jgi:AcrR family transcriptional regulator
MTPPRKKKVDPKSPTPRAPERTKTKLIAAAKRLFARGGLHGVAVSEIAREAGVSTAMINHHFGGKEGLYRACVAGFGAARLAALERLVITPKTREELEIRLEQIVLELLELHVEDRDMVAILLRDANSAEHWGPDVERGVYQFSVTLSGFFAGAQKRGLVRSGIDPMTPAALLYLTLSGLLQVDAHRERVTGTSLRDPAHRRALVKRLIDVVLHGALA